MFLPPKIIELSLKRDEIESVLYPKLRHAVFHYSFGKKFEQIMKSGHLAVSGSADLKGTSIHSDISTGKHLKAVCLFDLRDKTDEEIAPGKSYYDFLDPHPKITQAIYFLVSKKHYEDITVFADLDSHTKEHTMYLPVIESWHVGHLPLHKLECIYVVNILGG